MVSQITVGYPNDEHGRPFRRRRSRPAAIAGVVLLALAAVVWVIAAMSASKAPVPVACPSPPAPTAAPGTTPPPAVKHTVVGHSQMIDTAPAPLSTFSVRVLNASGQRGAAHNALEDLTALGFRGAPTDSFADDPLYPSSMNCVAQIRYGDSTTTAAASVWLTVPCAELVNDGRTEPVVDLALGTHYTATEQSQDAQAALAALRAADPNNPKSAVDPALVRAVHAGAC